MNAVAMPMSVLPAPALRAKGAEFRAKIINLFPGRAPDAANALWAELVAYHEATKGLSDAEFAAYDDPNEFHRYFVIVDALEALPVTPNSAAALIMREISVQASDGETLAGSLEYVVGMYALPALLPYLTGNIREAAQGYLDNPGWKGDEIPLRA